MAGLQLVQLIMVNWPEYNLKRRMKKKKLNLYFSYISYFYRVLSESKSYYTFLFIQRYFNSTVKCNTQKNNVIYIL